jgi:hypothetical protein
MPVTHEELRALLPPYAAGDLEESAADMVRAHLATGCVECLDDVFGWPVGQRPPTRSPGSSAPRADSTQPAPPPVDRGPIAGTRSLARWWPAAALLVGLAPATLAVWSVHDLRLREVVQREEAVRLRRRLTEAETERADLAARLDVLDRQLAAARDEAARHADAVRATAEESARLGAEVEAARARAATLLRGIHRRDVEIDRLLDDRNGARTTHELVATPGVEVLRLRAVAPFGGVRGHVVWHPGRPVVVLCAFDLPALAEGAHFRVRLDLGKGAQEEGWTFTPGPRGDVVLPIRLGERPAALREVQVLREPAAEPVLTGAVARPAW